MKKKALGKGLDALIPENPIETISTDKESALIEIPIDKVDPNPNQPRKNFDEDKLRDLIASIKQSGLIQPIIVRRKGNRYELIAGERRLKAAEKADLMKIKALLAENLTPSQRIEIALVENLQRDDLNPIETAEGIKRLMLKGNITQEQASMRLGKDRSTIANLLRLLNLPEEIREELRNGVLSAGHGRALAGLGNSRQQKLLWRQAVKGSWSVRKLEEKVRKLSEPKNENKTYTRTSPYTDIEDRLREHFGTKVKISKSRRGGVIEIEFYDDDQLDGLIEKFGI